MIPIKKILLLCCLFSILPARAQFNHPERMTGGTGLFTIKSGGRSGDSNRIVNLRLNGNKGYFIFKKAVLGLSADINIHSESNPLGKEVSSGKVQLFLRYYPLKNESSWQPFVQLAYGIGGYREVGLQRIAVDSVFFGTSFTRWDTFRAFDATVGLNKLFSDRVAFEIAFKGTFSGVASDINPINDGFFGGMYFGFQLFSPKRQRYTLK